jgi:hypothetical protein
LFTHLPEVEGVGSYMPKIRVLLLYEFLEGADRLGLADLNLKHVLRIIADDPAVEVESGGHDGQV